MGREDELGDVDVAAFRAEAHRLVDWIADYLAAPERYPVLSAVTPGRRAPRHPRRRLHGRPSRSRRSSTTFRRRSFPA